MDAINQNTEKNKTNKSKIMETLEDLKLKPKSLQERFIKAKIVGIENSTRYNEDNSFHSLHQRIMAYKDKLNEEEINDPHLEKENYYNSEYWFKNGITQRVGTKEYLYDYDPKNNEIILKYYKDTLNNNTLYANDLSYSEQKEVKEVLFFGKTNVVDFNTNDVISEPKDLIHVLEKVKSEYIPFTFNGKDYQIRWYLNQYMLNDDNKHLAEFRNSENVIEYFKELED